MKYEEYFKGDLDRIEGILEDVLPPADRPPSNLHGAMRYAVLGSGKRFRPVLALASSEACGGSLEEALLPAAAIELIHAYSLVHDDLPALDDDDTRRGKPAVHVKFGEAPAILTGDGLLTLAFSVLSRVGPPDKALELVSEISTAAGTYGMIGGQAADMEAEGSELDLPTLDFINVHKTGKLIRSSAIAGAIVAGAGKKNRQRMLRFGEFLGLAFQSVDDLLDGDGYLRAMKPRALREQVRDLIAKAKQEVRPLGDNAAKLIAIADFLLDRMPKETPDHVSMDS